MCPRAWVASVPCTRTQTEVNDAISDTPEQINDGPYAELDREDQAR